jgi:CRAL/TRIO domain
MSSSEKSCNSTEEFDINKIKEIQDKYYSTNKKNMFFKKKQKVECANYVCNYIPIEYLLSQTIFIVYDTNKVYIDYTIFKLFANPDNFKYIVTYIVNVVQQCMDIHENFQIHINLDTFSVSAVERYKEIIKFFVEHCISSQTQYSEKMQHMFIYNTPKSFDNIIKILKPFIDNKVYNKFTLCDERISFEQIEQFKKIRDNMVYEK